MSRKAAIIKQKNTLSRPREREYECANTRAHEHYLLMYYGRKNKSCPSMVCIKRSEVCNLARRLELQTSSCHCWERCSGQGTLGILSAKLRTLTLKKVSVILSMPGRGQSWGQWVRYHTGRKRSRRVGDEPSETSEGFLGSLEVARKKKGLYCVTRWSSVEVTGRHLT